MNPPHLTAIPLSLYYFWYNALTACYLRYELPKGMKQGCDHRDHKNCPCDSEHFAVKCRHMCGLCGPKGVVERGKGYEDWLHRMYLRDVPKSNGGYGAVAPVTKEKKRGRKGRKGKKDL